MTDTWRRLVPKMIEADPPPEDPKGRIQYKGTDLCIDLYCECETTEHLDGEFIQFWQCPNCGKRYMLSAYVKLIETDPIMTHEEFAEVY